MVGRYLKPAVDVTIVDNRIAVIMVIINFISIERRVKFENAISYFWITIAGRVKSAAVTRAIIGHCTICNSGMGGIIRHESAPVQQSPVVINN